MESPRLESARKTRFARRVARLRTRFAGEGTGGVLRNMATLALGAGAARALGVAAIPVLTRLYSPEDYGALAAFTALVLMLTPLTTLCYGMAIPLPKRDEMAANLLALTLLVTLAGTLLIALALWAVGPWFLTLISMEPMIPWWGLLPVALLGASLFETLSFWATRARVFRALARAQVIQTVLGVGAQILLGLAGIKPAGLLIGHTLQRGGGSTTLLAPFRGRLRELWPAVTWARMGMLAARHRGYPLYRLPSQFLLAASAQGPLILTSALYAAGETGQLGLALMALAVPMSLFGHTMGRAFYGEIASIGPRRPEQVRALTHAVLKRLALVAAPAAGVLMLFGPELFSLVFGAEWEMAGRLASLLSIYLLFQFLATPVSYILYVFEGQKLLLGLNIQRAVLVAGAFGAAHVLAMPLEDTILLYSVLISAHYAASILITLRKIPSGAPDL
ncbi:lipopolysaccharide biosynthesis protein [Albimonas pacifica]|uniref:Membrane protein involved in the export of O-antigen and teichoic acid n=1 Tax=Albimonas pacifica TaxID=1114924 RepID=A0A1I3PR20_9RHOB|nr:oligosaccharide flippase family protein [Albimonas pacifica]SFJ24018.1 Membrane protein involved in the export of O-antigen and teichoic acid [Albimonas pacifica]